MKFIKKVIKLFSLDKKTMLLFIEACLYLGWARFLISFPFRKAVPTLGSHMHETSFALNAKNKTAIMDVQNAIQVVSGHTFWESKCLAKAIAAGKMLQKRGIESTLYLGTAKNENAELIAHAWLRSGPFYITGAEVMNRFTVVGKFARWISNE